MSGFLVDEDLPRSLAAALRDAGLPSEDVRDVGLGGKADEEILAYARANRRVLLTRDVMLSSVTRLTAAGTFGLVLVRFRETITVLEPGRVRQRRRR